MHGETMKFVWYVSVSNFILEFMCSVLHLRNYI